MATPDSDSEIEDDPRVDLSSSQLDRAGRSALAASGRQDRNLTREAGKDAPVGEGRRLGRPLQAILKHGCNFWNRYAMCMQLVLVESSHDLE